jgi:hypothetical protein
MVPGWMTYDEEGFWRFERVRVDGWVAGVGEGGWRRVSDFMQAR